MVGPLQVRHVWCLVTSHSDELRILDRAQHFEEVISLWELSVVQIRFRVQTVR